MKSSIAIASLLLFVVFLSVSGKSHVKRAVMTRLGAERCRDEGLNRKVGDSHVVATGTVEKCQGIRAGSYPCTVKVWRVLKGSGELENVTSINLDDIFSFMSASFIEVAGFGNKKLCKSNVEVGDTKIFFLRKFNDKLIMTSSFSHVTLENLEDVDDIVAGKVVPDRPAKPYDPCLDVLCGYGARCQVTGGIPDCLCPLATDCVVTSQLCGSDGVTYESECHLKAAQCEMQKKIKIVDEKICRELSTYPLLSTIITSSRISTTTAATTTTSSAPSSCGSCGDHTAVVCGSDGASYRNKCELEKRSCESGRKIKLVRYSACDPCTSYNSSLNQFVPTCPGACSFDARGSPTCCSDIVCDYDVTRTVCGNDGRSYQSECAMRKYACQTGQELKAVSKEACKSDFDTTLIHGTFSVDADRACKNTAGNCNLESKEFKRTLKRIEKFINLKLAEKNTEHNQIIKFEIEKVQKGSLVIFYKAEVSASKEPTNWLPGDEYKWAYRRLFHPDNGAVTLVARQVGVNLVDMETNLYNFFADDICLDIRCEKGAKCKIFVTDVGELIPTCTCDAIPNPDHVRYSPLCSKRENATFANKLALRREVCWSEEFVFATKCNDFQDTCDGKCGKPGEGCVVKEGEASCVCVSCKDEYVPVCGSDGNTYKSSCKLEQYNCENKKNVKVSSAGTCNNPCEGMECPIYGTCRNSEFDGRECRCPECPETSDDAEVCGTDDRTYKNECQLKKLACEDGTEVIVNYEGPCTTEESGSGSGELDCYDSADLCLYGECEFVDNEYRCVCDFECELEEKKELCGSDGVTYKSICELNKSSCQNNMIITMKHEGSCSADKTCDCFWKGTVPNKECDPVTKQCPCLPFVGGLRCDRCVPGYWDLRSVGNNVTRECRKCECNVYGSKRQDCNQTDGKCSCVTGVKGDKCDTCPDGSEITRDLCRHDNKQDDNGLCKGVTCERADHKCRVVGDQLDQRAVCSCITLADCNDQPEDLVCGSDGNNYHSECAMHAMTCSDVIGNYDVVTVHKRGKCGFDEEPSEVIQPSENDKEDELSEGSGSGSMPPDDDEGDDDEEGSGYPGSKPPSEINAAIYRVDGSAVMALDEGEAYKTKLKIKGSKEHEKYKKKFEDEIYDQLTEVAELSGKVRSVRVTQFSKAPSSGRKVSVDFSLSLNDDVSSSEVGEYLTNHFLQRGGPAGKYRFRTPGSATLH